VTQRADSHETGESGAEAGEEAEVEAEKTSDVIDVSYGKVGEPETPACVLQNLSKLYVEKHLQLLRPSGAANFLRTKPRNTEGRLTKLKPA
jgi:hypothetical protein